MGDWLRTPAAERDIAAGALMLLRITGNHLQHAVITQQPEKYAGMLEYQLQKHYNYRVAGLTAAELEQLSTRSAANAEEIGLTLSRESADESAAAKAGFGKRADHDSLPEDVKALYVENLEVRRKMQQLHLKIRTKYAEITDCTASDVYAFVHELLDLEAHYIANWERYDTATPETPQK